MRYIKISGGAQWWFLFIYLFTPGLLAPCFLPNKGRDGPGKSVMPQLYHEFILLLVRGRASTVLVSAVMLNKL